MPPNAVIGQFNGGGLEEEYVYAIARSARRVRLTTLSYSGFSNTSGGVPLSFFSPFMNSSSGRS